MNTEKIKQINEIVEEANAFKAKVDSMEKECAAIKKYCLEALHDLRDTFCVAEGLMIENPDLGGRCNAKAYLGNPYTEDGGGFTYYPKTEEKQGEIMDIHATPRTTICGLVCSNIVSKSTIDQAIKAVDEKEDVDIQYWLSMKEHADETRLMCEAILDALRISADRCLRKQKKLLEDGIAAGSKEYERVT